MPSSTTGASAATTASTATTKIRSTLNQVFLQEDLNFLLTNRIPRRLATRFMGWFSRIETPAVRDLSIRAWQLFSALDMDEAASQRYRSLHDCFIRELKEGARPVDTDPSLLVSPCDAIVGASGRVEGTRVIQAKGFPYTLQDLLHDPALCDLYRDGSYVTLRLTAGMYHRFHAPFDCRVEKVTYISGDTWNTNPIAVNRVEKLFCKNERAVVEARLPSGDLLTLVPVASILVAGIRLRCLKEPLRLDHRGPNVFACDAPFGRGEQMGWFELGSTIIVFAPRGFGLSPGVLEGTTIRMGQPLLRLPS